MVERVERSRVSIVRVFQGARLLHATLSGNPELVAKLCDKFGIGETDKMGYVMEATNIQYEVPPRRQAP